MIPAGFYEPPKSKRASSAHAERKSEKKLPTVDLGCAGKVQVMKTPSRMSTGETTESLRTNNSSKQADTEYFYYSPTGSSMKPMQAGIQFGINSSVQVQLADPDKAKFIKNSRKVTVTCVINPLHFYVNQDIEMVNDKLCRDDAEEMPTPEEVRLGSLYLTQSRFDQRWYRCRVLGRSLRNSKYLVQFIDYGHADNVLHSRLRVLPDDMQRVDDTACKCALYDVVPADGSKDWTPDVRKIINNFVEGKEILMYMVQDYTDVDIIAHTIDGPKSLRECLFYLKIAQPDPNPPKRNEAVAQLIVHLEKVKKRWIKEYRRTIPAKYLQKDDVFRTKIVSSVSPNEFYICNSSWIEAYQKMKVDLEGYCNKGEARIVYSPHVGMLCIFAHRNCDGFLVWKRGRIFKVGKGSCKVDSVDTGHRVTVSWQDIREIPHQFSSTPELAVRCCLMDIQSFMENFYQWTDKAVDFFNRIARTSFVFQVIVGEQEVNCYAVALYLIRRRHDICVNGLMVSKKFAVSIGPESTIVEIVKKVQEIEKKNSNQPTAEHQVTRRAKVEILRVVSPNEFYVNLITNDSRMARMQEYIRKNIHDKTNEGADRISWQNGEMCLMLPTPAIRKEFDTLDSEWYRARVLEVLGDRHYKVFLIDNALTIICHHSRMRPIVPAILKEFYPFAIRCSLACINPTGRMVNWSSSVVDAFKVAIEKFQFFSISLLGRCVNNCIPVILWGMTVDGTNALSSQLYTYTNVNKKLVHYGYAHLNEKFPPLTATLSVEEELEHHYQRLDEFLNNLDVETDDSDHEQSNCDVDDDYQHDITDELTPIDHWLPAVPIDKAVFVGIPTAVDAKGVIYLHDARLEGTLTAIRTVINANVKGSHQLLDDQFYSSGEPCLAKNYIDGLYYRAVVRKAVSPRRYEVQLVDYGIVEVCHVKELRKNIVCGRVPILANKYRLTGVIPKQSEDIWPFVVLDSLNALIEDMPCQIRVDTDMDTDVAGVVPCSIQTTGEFSVDVSTHLLNTFESLYNPFANLFENLANSSTVALNAEDRDKSVVDDNGVESYFNEKELTDLLETIRVTAERHEDEDDDSELDLSQNHYFYSYGEVKLKDEEEASANFPFNPNECDTSPQTTSPLETKRLQFNGYLDFTLDKSVHGFYCEVTNLLDPFNLLVFPQIDEHMKLMTNMMAYIQFYGKRHGPNPAIREHMPCLAKYTQDGHWYRALVVKHYTDQAKVRVLYVDYLNEETISVLNITNCPSSLLTIPLRNVQIKLHALQINPRLRIPDATMKLVELIEGKQSYARVVAHYPALEVELFTNDKCERLIYHQMIRDKHMVSMKYSP